MLVGIEGFEDLRKRLEDLHEIGHVLAGEVGTAEPVVVVLVAMVKRGEVVQEM